MSVHLAAYAILRATFWVKGVLQQGQKLGMAILLNTDIESIISRGLFGERRQSELYSCVQAKLLESTTSVGGWIGDRCRLAKSRIQITDLPQVWQQTCSTVRRGHSPSRRDTGCNGTPDLEMCVTSRVHQRDVYLANVRADTM